MKRIHVYPFLRHKIKEVYCRFKNYLILAYEADLHKKYFYSFCLVNFQVHLVVNTLTIVNFARKVCPA